MNIESIDDLFNRIGELIEVLKNDEKYSETYDVLVTLYAEKEQIIYGSEDVKMSIADTL